MLTFISEVEGCINCTIKISNCNKSVNATVFS